MRPKRIQQQAPTLYFVFEDEEYKGPNKEPENSLYDSSNWTDEDRHKFFQPAHRSWKVTEAQTGTEYTLIVRQKGVCALNETTGAKHKIQWKDIMSLERTLSPSALAIVVDDGFVGEYDVVEGVLHLYYVDTIQNNGAVTVSSFRTDRVIQLERTLKRYIKYSESLTKSES
jgi:hypothetical protein